jgi:hypothetical protein
MISFERDVDRADVLIAMRLGVEANAVADLARAVRDSKH